MRKAGFLAFLLPFIAAFLFVAPGVYDTTMMSRLALYPLLGAFVFLCGRDEIGLWHLIAGATLIVIPSAALLLAPHPLSGVPYAVRFLSFGLMIAGFSGTVAKWGVKPHLEGLAAAAALVSILMVVFGADSLTGNPNRAGMLLPLGLVSALSAGSRRKAVVLSALIIPGLVVSEFYISWAAALLGAVILLLHRRFTVNPALIPAAIILAQSAFTMMPSSAGRIGPTLELRTLIWRTSAELCRSSLPLGMGTGQARLQVYAAGGSDLQALAGADSRVDFLHSEPLTLLTEFGVTGFAMLAAFLLWLLKSREEGSAAALLAAFWLVFTTDLPLATPLGALPAALVIGACLTPGRRTRVPIAIPLVFIAASIPWAYTVLRGYHALNRPDDPRSASEACRYIPFEERAFLQAGWVWLRAGSPLEAEGFSERAVSVYPLYHGGWELRASVLGSLGRPGESASAWRRAFMLAPGNHGDRMLFALNGIPLSENSRDTLLAMGNALSEAVMWRELYPWIRNDSYREIAHRCLVLAQNLLPENPALSGAVFAAAVITGENCPEPDRAEFLLEAYLVYERFRELVPSERRNKVEALIEQR